MTRMREKMVIWYCWSCGLILFAVTFSLLAYLVFQGIGTINLKLIFGETDPLKALFLQQTVFDGLFPAMAGTLMLICLSIAVAIPIGFTTGIYLAEYADTRVKSLFNLVFDILAGIPSILVGLFGFSLALFLHKHYSEKVQPCLLISSLALAFLVLPYIIRTTQAALEDLPHNIRLTALSLGATKLQNLFYVLLPKSLSGIISGIILAIGRCAEDTAVIMLTGVVVSAGIPKSLASPYEAIPFYIYYISSQYANPDELSRGYGAALILLMICLFLFALAFVIKKHLTYIAFYRP
jgi:phosphate transport system permease protein